MMRSEILKDLLTLYGLLDLNKLAKTKELDAESLEYIELILKVKSRALKKVK